MILKYRKELKELSKFSTKYYSSNGNELIIIKVNTEVYFEISIEYTQMDLVIDAYGCRCNYKKNNRLNYMEKAKIENILCSLYDNRLKLKYLDSLLIDVIEKDFQNL